MKKAIFIYVLILLAITDNNAQNNNNLVEERITIFSDRNEYIPGENIWFKAFINNKNKKNESKIIYTELISPYGFSVSRKKLPVISGSAEGNFIIPDTSSTGYYTLLAYTNYSKNIGCNMFEIKKILIYNPEKRNKTLNAKVDTLNRFYTENNDLLDSLKKRKKDDQINITKLKIGQLSKTYDKRSNVSFLIQLPEEKNYNNADLCVSVRKSYPKDDLKNSYSVNHRTNNIFDKETIDTTLPAYWENYGPIIWGEITNNNQLPLSNIKVYLNYIDSVSSMQIDKTDLNGRFKFIVNSDKNINDIIIKADTKEEVSIKIYSNYLDNYYRTQIESMGLQDSIYLSYLNELYLNHRINRVYRIKYSNENINVENSDLSYISWKKTNFYGKADKIIKFDDYILLDSIQEYFHEFFPSVIINNQKGTRTFKIVNNFKEVLVNQPAIFIDGVLYRDNEILFAINPAQCDRIEVVKSDYLIYDKVYGGLICLYTKGHDLNTIPIPKNSSRIMYKLYDETARFKKIEHKNNIPDFRNTLYWESNIHLKSNDSYTIDFVTGDDKSKYEVVIFGFTSDGQLINESRIFEVK